MRDFGRRLLLKMMGVVAAAPLVPQGCSGSGGYGDGEGDAGSQPTPLEAAYDYIVVGSGAGGAPLAANLARAGFKVLVLEAGRDLGDSLTYKVPLLNASATES